MLRGRMTICPKPILATRANLISSNRRETSYIQSVSRKLLNSKKEALSHVLYSQSGPLVRFNGKVNANAYQNLLQRYAVLPLQASPN